MEAPRRPPEEMSCYGRARLLVEEMGGPKVARIYRITIRIGEVSDDSSYEHGFVIPVNANDTDTPLNQEEFAVFRLKVGTIRRQGIDVTEEILKTPWNEL